MVMVMIVMLIIIMLMILLVLTVRVMRAPTVPLSLKPPPSPVLSSSTLNCGPLQTLHVGLGGGTVSRAAHSSF